MKSITHGSEPIPYTRFLSTAHDGCDQFDAWRERISVVFDVAPIDDTATRAFSAEATAHHLGELILVRTRFERQRFLRTPRQVRSDLLDHYLVQLYRKGGYVGDVEGREIAIAPGTVSVLDLARPLATRATSAECLSLIVPRDRMHDALQSTANLHGILLTGDSGAFLADYLLSLERRLSGLAQAQAPHIVRATCDLLAACLQPSVETQERAREPLRVLQLQKLARLIDQRIGSRDLSPAKLCSLLACSRTTLYEALKPHGGVRRYVQRRRLLRVHAALANPSEKRSITELAESHGFASHAHLSRAFRDHFGYRPSDIRADPSTIPRTRAGGAGTARDAGNRKSPGFDDWIRELRRV